MAEGDHNTESSGASPMRRPRRVRARRPGRDRIYIEGGNPKTARLANGRLQELQDRVAAIEAAYNPDHLDLHFDVLVRADAALFEALYSIGLEAWRVIRKHQSYKSALWFYDWFLLISDGSLKWRSDRKSGAISRDVIERLAVLLVEISEMTTVEEYSGDITKRNYEALTNLQVAFNRSEDLGRTMMDRAKRMNSQRVCEFVESTMATVRIHMFD